MQVASDIVLGLKNLTSLSSEDLAAGKSCSIEKSIEDLAKENPVQALREIMPFLMSEVPSDSDVPGRLANIASDVCGLVKKRGGQDTLASLLSEFSNCSDVLIANAEKHSDSWVCWRIFDLVSELGQPISEGSILILEKVAVRHIDEKDIVESSMQALSQNKSDQAVLSICRILENAPSEMLGGLLFKASNVLTKMGEAAKRSYPCFARLYEAYEQVYSDTPVSELIKAIGAPDPEDHKALLESAERCFHPWASVAMILKIKDLRSAMTEENQAYLRNIVDVNLAYYSENQFVRRSCLNLLGMLPQDPKSTELLRHYAEFGDIFDFGLSIYYVTANATDLTETCAFVIDQLTARKTADKLLEYPITSTVRQMLDKMPEQIKENKEKTIGLLSDIDTDEACLLINQIRGL